MPSDVIAAIQAQNTEVAAGEIGGQPQPPRPDAQRHRHRAVAAADARAVPRDHPQDRSRRRDACGSSDVARVELGAESYDAVSRVNGHPGAGIADLARAGRRRADDRRAGQGARSSKRAANFPPGLKYAYANDTTAFIKLSIEEVVKTLIEAIILVVIVMFVFLQSWRATLIPAIAVPVVLLGTFGDLRRRSASRSTR